MKLFVSCIIFVFMFSSAALGADAPKKAVDNRIAVFDLETIGVVDKDLSRPITEGIRLEIVKTGKYDVVFRDKMKKAFGDEMFQMSGCLTGECIVEAGQILGAARIVTGSISTVGSTYYILLSLVNAMTGKIEYISEEKCQCSEADLVKSSEGLVKRLIGDIDISKKETLFTGAQCAVVSEKARFTFYELAVKDKESKLMWTRNANIPGKNMAWGKSNDYIKQLNRHRYAGFSDWRLPSKEELESLVRYAQGKGYESDIDAMYNDLGFNNIQADSYWTSTSHNMIAVYAWYINMWNGKDGVGSKDFFGYIWPVRSAP